MNRNSSRFINYLAAPGMALLLSACGGGGGGGAGTGALSVSVTDSPVLEDVDVCIHFTGITMHHTDGDLIQIPYDSSTYYDDTDGCVNNVASDDPNAENNAIALSSLQGALSVSLMESADVKAGRYTWIRLDVDESLSYVMDSLGQHNLICPSCDGEQSGLKLNQEITVPEGGASDFMIDVDLGKSLNKDPSGIYKLRPILRLVDLTETGMIAGSVAGTLVASMISDTDTGSKVYIYAGHDITPDDYHETDNVLTSAKVLYDPVSMSYKYVAAYLPADSTTAPTPYSVALTCNMDDPEVDQGNDPSSTTNGDVIFNDGLNDGMGQNADAYTNQTTVVNFPPVL
jgi:hypothetical protein